MSNIFKILSGLLGLIFKSRAGDKVVDTLQPAKTEKTDSPYTGFKVVIDPGHGGRNGKRDPGAVGKYLDATIYERDVVLEICSSLAYKLDAMGFSVVMTRIDNDVHGLSTLPAKAKIVKNESPDIFVSVHANANSGNPAQGIETFYNKERPESLKLAKSVQKSLVSTFTGHKDRGVKDGSHLYILKAVHSVQAECLVECEFINHPEQAKFLVENPDEIAKAIAAGIINYIKK